MHLIALLSVLLFVGVTQASRNYVGCFADDTQLRAMYRVLQSAQYQQVMTNRLCADECRDQGYEYAATQRGFQCYCGSGNGFAMYGRRNDDKCKDNCKGDSSEKCGGNARNSVYSTGMWYNGCFENYISSGYQLSYLAYSDVGASDSSVFKCVETCSDLGYLFAGPAYYNYVDYYTYETVDVNSCYCGNSFGNGFSNEGVVDDGFCNNECPSFQYSDIYYPGFDDQFCGGYDDYNYVEYISIYHTLI